MALVLSNTNLSAVTYAAGETITIRNGATLTVDSTVATLPGTIQCITSGKLRVENNSTTTPIRLALSDMNKDFQFEGNGVFEVRGQMMTVGTGTGAAQSFNLGTLYSNVINDLTYVEVETSAGSNVYDPWPIVSVDPKYFNVGRSDGGGAQSEFVGTPHVAGKVAFWHDANRTLSFGDNVNGWSAPNGCKIRIPNILITNDYATDASLIHAIVSEGTPTGGTFTITITNRKTGVVLGTTAAIAFNATAATIDTAIEAITGANTVTSAGGALPTAVSITWAGGFASTPLALTVNSSVTGGTSSIIYTRENAATNLTLIDLNPSGTLDAENCMFSQKIRISNDAWSKARLVGVGLGADTFAFNNSNGDVEVNKMSFVNSPYCAASSSQFTNVLGEVSIQKAVFSTRRSGAFFQIQSVPSLTKCDDLTFISYYATARSAANRAVFNFATLAPNLNYNRINGIGGRWTLTNLTNNIWFDCKTADNVRSTQDAGNAVSAFQIANCVNQVFLNTKMAGVAAVRNYFFVPDINSLNIQIVGANFDAANNTSSLLQPNGKITVVKNSKIANVRTGAFIDQPATYTASGISAQKVFNTYATAQSTSGLDVAQDAVYDLLSSTIAGITETFASVENYVGGNFADPSLTPTTGHITFGPVGRGAGYTTVGTTYTSQTGFAKLEAINDVMELEIPFAMHGVTAFQNVAPSVWFDGSGAVALNHTIIAPGAPTGGTFTVTVRNANNSLIGTSAAIAFNASTATVDSAIEAIAGIGAGQITVGGSLAAGYTIALGGTLAATPLIFEVNGSALTGGTEPGVAYAFGRARLLANESFGPNTLVEFGLSTATGAYAAYQALSPANLVAALSGLSGYSAGDGLKMKVRITALTNDPNRAFSQLSMPTNINPSLWDLTDSTITFTSVQPTDTVEVRKLSDNSLIYTFTGGGQKGISAELYYGHQVYFVRKTSGGATLKTTIATPLTVTVNNNGSVDLKEKLISVLGVQGAETCEMRLTSNDSVVYSRTGSGDFVLNDADIGVSVYFARINGGVVVASTKFAPVVLAETNLVVKLFTGDEVQIAQSPEITAIKSVVDANLDVAVSTRLSAAGYSQGATLAQIEGSAILAKEATAILAQKILRNKRITDPATGLQTIFDDDGVTVLLSGNVFEDAAGSQLYRGQGADRVERLA